MKCKNLHPHNFSYFIYFFFIKTDQIFWGGFKRQKVDILCLTLVHLSFCFVRFFLGYSVDLAGQTVTELHATVMRELCSPGSGRCTRAWSFWISYSTLKPRHLAHEEHPRCCYKRPPAALGTRERGGGDYIHTYTYIYIYLCGHLGKAFTWWNVLLYIVLKGTHFHELKYVYLVHLNHEQSSSVHCLRKSHWFYHHAC